MLQNTYYEYAIGSVDCGPMEISALLKRPYYNLRRIGLRYIQNIRVQKFIH